MDEEKIFYNAVALALDGNPSSIRILEKKILKRYGDLLGKWRTAYEFLRSASVAGKIILPAPLPNPAAAWEKLEHAGVRLIFPGENGFPPLLCEMNHAPLAIYVRSEVVRSEGARSEARELPDSVISGNTLAIVGTRRATPDGKATARRFGRELADAGFAIASGLALGIDAAAHEGWLESWESSDIATDDATSGGAVAVLAGGLDKFYPKENERLGRRILERGGAIISEYPLGAPPYADRFLERNRIVCGLARGVLIIECPQRSGSLATAMYAREQNRDLFVVPGPIAHPNFFGSHQLIRQGALLVTKPEEILEEYDVDVRQKLIQEEMAATPEEKQVLLVLRGAAVPLEVDKIIELARLEPRVANQTLTFLLMKHLIKETEAGYIIE